MSELSKKELFELLVLVEDRVEQIETVLQVELGSDSLVELQGRLHKIQDKLGRAIEAF